MLNSQNGGADFRLGADQVALGLRRVQLVREGFKAMHFEPAVGLEFQIYGAPELTYELETSAQLGYWEPLARLRPLTSVSRHVATTPLEEPHRWYRLRRPPP